MPDVREKLVELIAQKVCDIWSEACDEWIPHDCGKCYANNCSIAEAADHLIANGVTIQRWIPVEERLPDHFGVFVVAISEPGNMRVGKDCADFDPFAKTWLPSMCWDRGYKVSHWMPLPEPPKEE